MKKIFLIAIAALVTAFSANAQVKIESPHPDLDIKITRCAYASGTVVIDMVITNFGMDQKISFPGSHAGYTSTTTAYDDEGNQYTSKNSKISLGLLSQGLGSGNGSSILFPQDVPLKFRVQLEKISSSANKFPLIRLGVDDEGGPMNLSREKPIVIRNLEWVK